MGETRRWPLPFADRPQLDLMVAAAAISLRPLPEGETPYLETTVGGPLELRVDVSREGEVVQVRLGHRDAFWEMGPHVKLVAFLPANVRARVRADFGKVEVEGLDQGCDLDLSTSAGTLVLSRVVGRMHLRTGAGKIAGERLAGTFDVETAAGTIQLGITGLQAGAHRIRTNMGSVKVELAPGIPVRIQTKTSMGSVRVKYPSHEDAPSVLELVTDLGAVKVKEGNGDSLHGDFPRWDGMGGWDPSAWAREWTNALTAPFTGRPAAPPTTAPGNARRAAIGDEELRRILAMIEQGKITAQDGERLIRAIEDR